METLPPGAREFLRSLEGRAAARIARSFHRWLADNGLDVTRIMPNAVWWFVSVLGSKESEHYATVTVASDRWFQLFPYIEWLWRRELLCFHPDVLRSAPPPPSVDRDPCSVSTDDAHFLWCTQDWRPFLRPKQRTRRNHSRALLPDPAQRFLAMLAATRKPSTVTGYAYDLGRFHRFLDEQQLTLRALARHHIEDWCRRLHAEGLHASTRLTCLFQTRAYLHWAHEQGLVAVEPDLLIRRSDLPKLPQYLPRPLSPDVDRELQARLAAGNQHQLGLLLMRRTGLRIGELAGLDHDCLRADAKGRLYLKVSLGKLDTERLVPLDDETVDLIRRMQRVSVSRTLLLGDPRGEKPRYDLLRAALRATTPGLVTTEPITSHRLRHTYATTLLAGGMSLPALMRVLGHRDHRMTLRYAAITDDLVVKEYHDALTKLGARYSAGPPEPPASDTDPLVLLADVARWVKSRTASQPAKNALVKRLRRLIDDLSDFVTPPPR